MKKMTADEIEAAAEAAMTRPHKPCSVCVQLQARPDVAAVVDAIEKRGGGSTFQMRYMREKGLNVTPNTVAHHNRAHR